MDNVSLTIKSGQTLGLVGESGCGKSVTAHSIMRLIPDPPGKIEGGEIFFDGQDLLKVTECQMRKIRGNRISMIFQEPMTSLNPVFPVGDQVAEVIRLHQGLSRSETRERVLETFHLVGIPAAESRLDDYPHQMSGGMRQRVMIAMALACNPKLMIADEPTTALDVTIQAQILDLMNKLKDGNRGRHTVYYPRSGGHCRNGPKCCGHVCRQGHGIHRCENHFRQPEKSIYRRSAAIDPGAGKRK